MIVGRPTTTVQETLSDLDIEIEDDPDYPEAPDLGKSDSKDYEDLYLRRRGQESSFRRQRPNQFYAMLVDEQQRKVVGVGPLLGKDEPWEVANDGDVVTVYPVDSEGNERTWRYVRETMMSYIEQGVIVVGQKTKNGYALNHRKPKTAVKRLKTVWWDKAHDAGVHGTNVVTKLLGSSGLFPFPKSVYAVRDCLAAVCRERRDALIVDCFAGSGTTLHAITLLNAEDDGSRRCILVTNNEVQENDATALNKEGYYRGSPEFERRGIFEQVTKPRVTAALTGKRADGSTIEGNHRGGRPFAEGFPENVEFYRLDYLDPDEVDLGLQFEAILPTLWMAAGGVGDREKPEKGQAFSIPEGSTYGVLFNESMFRHFREALEQRPDVSHVWLVTDSEEAYAEMGSALPRRLKVSMLYRDYLRNIKINTERNL